jgi:Flp pilus assembly protein TadG
MSGLRREQRGQASVETVALAPLVILCCLLGLQGLIAGSNFIAAANAAHAGALAGQLGRDPKRAACRSAAGWSTSRVHVRTTGRRVAVELRPRAILPGLAGLLVARAEAGYAR